MKSLEIRKKFFDFFVKNHHEKITSSSLIPAQDPTLLFTNAGMNQFKDLFLGNEKRSYARATTIQKCVRAGGKHNDLDNVGFTKRHLTFFEMMGNFSFADYFKKDAIAFAWNLLTKEYKLNPDNLYVSVFEKDDEAFDIWHKEIGVEKERIMRFGAKDNFWQMGDTGPCGPCTEIYVDLRSTEDKKIAPTYADFDEGRLLEIWNLVFMQFDRQPDGTLVPLKQTGVDTGMGLERIACVLQNKDSVFQTDLFAPLIKAIEKLTDLSYEQQDSQTKAAFHVLCDHVRSTSLIIADGGSPSNEGRGYVLRKIIRRAALFAQKLSERNIFPELASVFIEEMGTIYPELITNKTIIISLLRNEIDQFATNLVRGQTILQSYFATQQDSKVITGHQAFKLYDTYGFPLEVTILACQDRGFKVDSIGFEKAMEEQRLLSGKKMKEGQKTITLPETMITQFVGYQHIEIKGTIIGIIVDNQLVEQVETDTECCVIVDITPFFAATGGQVDDQGTVTIHNHIMPINGLKKLNHNKAVGIELHTTTPLKVKDVVEQKVDIPSRKATMYNHTGTHLLQAALIELLGKQVKQSGSVVTPDYLRFDFTYHQNLTPEQITWVENKVNEKIRDNIHVDIFETTYQKAVDRGVIAIFGEKYNPECVRVIDIPGFSSELCGGTHVPSTGTIGCFKITEVSALSAGNRRIVAVTGPNAVALMQDNFNAIKTLSQKFKAKPEDVVDAVEKQTELLQTTQQTITTLKRKIIELSIPSWSKEIEVIKEIPFLTLVLENYDASDLKTIVQILQKQKPGFYCVVSNNGSHAFYYAELAPQFTSTITIDALATRLKDTCDFKGGKTNFSLQGGSPRVNKPIAILLKDLFTAL